MLTETNSTLVRNLIRVAVVGAGLALGALASPASATAPASWDDPDNGSLLDALLLLVGVPVAICLILTLLVYLPSMVRSKQTGSAVAFQERPEWFGGPRQGAEAAESAPAADADRGGASGRF